MHDVASMTWGETVETAKADSGLTNAEIARRFNAATSQDVSPSNVQRWFSRYDEYWPSAPYIPVLCKILGNSLMTDWLAYQTRPEVRVETAGMTDILRIMPKLAKEMGDVGRVIDEVLGDNDFSASDARRVREELLDIQTEVGVYLARLAKLTRKGSRPFPLARRAGA